MIGRSPQPYVGERAEWAKQVRKARNYRSVELHEWIVICAGGNEAHRLVNRLIGNQPLFTKQDYFRGNKKNWQPAGYGR